MAWHWTSQGSTQLSHQISLLVEVVSNFHAKLPPTRSTPHPRGITLSAVFLCMRMQRAPGHVLVQNKNGGTGNLGIKLYSELIAAPPPIIFNMQSALILCFSWQEIAQLDLLCKQLYEATDTATRNAAERALSTFTNSPDCLTKCQYLLERGNVSLCSIHWLLTI